MIRLKPTYAKIIDLITIEEAPKELNGIKGFSNSKQHCNAYGYYQVNYTEKAGNVAIYTIVNESIVQQWVTIDSDLYAQNVVLRIRQRYSENDELAILRKAYAGIDKHKFDEYNEFCEACKKAAKLELITE